MFSHTFLLFQLLLSYSSIFAKLLLTNFFAPFLAARESEFLSRFSYHALQASTLYMHPHVSGTERVGFSKQDACGNLVVASLLVNFPFSAFCQRLLLQTPVGLNTIHTFLVNRLIVACFMTASSRFAQGNSAGLPCYKILHSGILNVPLPYGMHLKVSHEGRHIFEQLRPQQHRSAVDVTCNSWG